MDNSTGHMDISTLRRFAGAAVAITLMCALPNVANAGGSFTNEMSDTSATDLGTGKFESFPFKVSVTVRGGYDDNVNLDTFDEEESLFTNAGIGVTYQFGNARTQMALSAGAGATYYFDRDDDDLDDEDFDDWDYNVYLGFNITHRATPRLTLAAAVYATYQSQPDFATLNRNTFTISRNSRDFFFSSNRFSATYMWAPRFGTATHYTLGIVNYDDSFVSFFEDRWEHTIGQEFRFLIAPTTTIVGEYRFGIVDYTDFEDRSSTSHFLLAGFDHSFNPRFNMSARAGVEFRSFDDDDDFDALDDDEGDDDRTHPYAEATLNYALGQRTSVSWFNRYSLEQPDVADAFSRSTYRTSLGVRHNFTPRIVGGLNFAYQHDEYDGNILIEEFSEDAFDIALSVRYAINRNWAVDAGYQHTQVFSEESLFREFARNRYYLGATFSF
jgi:hypothetical protein